MRSLAPLLILLLILTACSPPPARSVAPSGGDEWTLVIADGDAGDGPGLSVSEALTHGPTDDIVTVTGVLFADAEGSVVLCEMILESLPPQCGGARIAVDGLDLATVEGLQEANGVRWAEGVTLLGSVE